MTKKHRQEALAQEAREKVRKPLTEDDDLDNVRYKAKYRYETSGVGDEINYSQGIALRDYFAAKAMQGMIASPRGTPDGKDATDQYYAKCAYIMADAMLKERNNAD